MPKNVMNYDSIQDEHVDDLIRLAYKQADALETQEILENDVRELTPDEEELCRRAYRSFLQKVDVQKRIEKKQKDIWRWKKRTSRFVSAAACLVLLLGIATPIALAKVEFIRVKVLQLLIDVQEEYTELSLVEDTETSFNVPGDWRGEYYLSYIPEGYALSYIDPVYDEVIYNYNDTMSIEYHECSIGDTVNVDSENANISYDFVHGEVALVIEKDDTVVTWSNGEKYFIVKTYLSREETLKIASSLHRIH